MWVKVLDPKNIKTVNLLSLHLDLGESSAVALALENEDSLLIIDERKGRMLALSLNLKITGLLGILIKAKESKHLTSVKEVLTELESVNFRISESLKKTVLELAKEG